MWLPCHGAECPIGFHAPHRHLQCHVDVLSFIIELLLIKGQEKKMYWLFFLLQQAMLSWVYWTYFFPLLNCAMCTLKYSLRKKVLSRCNSLFLFNGLQYEIIWTKLVIIIQLTAICLMKRILGIWARKLAWKDPQWVTIFPGKKFVVTKLIFPVRNFFLP